MSFLNPKIEVTRCVRYRYRYSGCQRCVDSCPQDAIIASDEGITIDVGKCSNCALCTTACPTAALLPDNLSRIDLLKEAIRGKRFRVACTPSGLAGDALVPCLGSLGTAWLAYLGKRGVELELAGTAHCEHCHHGSTGAATVARQVEARDAMEQSCAEEAWAPLILADGETSREADGFRPGRRSLFRRLVGRGVAEAAMAVESPLDVAAVDKAIRPGPWHVPEMRELLGITCRHAGHDQCALPVRQPELPAAEMLLAEGCTHCEACVRVCPTGALQIRETESDWNFLFFPERCVGCGVCTEVCQPRVLQPSESINASHERVPTALLILAKQRCGRCDRFFVSTEPMETCPVCEDDDKAFGDIFG